MKHPPHETSIPAAVIPQPITPNPSSEFMHIAEKYNLRTALLYFPHMMGTPKSAVNRLRREIAKKLSDGQRG